ncbi:MAG: ABC transporter substrate-binding protein [Sandaracinaceae bacterium]|nr:ABC transporter substrate-binding protein [Sandaracinaceae bacterium]
MSSLRTWAFGFALTGVLASAMTFTSRAQAQNADPEEFLRERHQTVERILSRPARTEADRARRQGELNTQLTHLLDYDSVAATALVDHWNGLSAAQRTEFVSLLRQLVERSYSRNLESTHNYVVRYAGVQAQNGASIVRTYARSRSNGRAPEVSIDYTLRQTDGVWKVTDVTTDGVSLVRNYRSQFHRIVQRDGWDALMRRMRERLAAAGDEI